MAGLVEWVGVLAASPGLRAAYGDVATVVDGPKAAVPRGRGARSDAPDRRPRGHDHRVPPPGRGRRHRRRFAIGLRPAQAEAAIPVLEVELEDESITVDVFIDDAVEHLIGDRTLEIVAPGSTGTGRAPVHEFDRGRPKPRSGKSPR